jgi:hypothetical protein
MHLGLAALLPLTTHSASGAHQQAAPVARGNVRARLAEIKDPLRLSEAQRHQIRSILEAGGGYEAGR